MNIKSDDVANFMYSACEARLNKLTPATSLFKGTLIEEQGTRAGNTIGFSEKKSGAGTVSRNEATRG